MPLIGYSTIYDIPFANSALGNYQAQSIQVSALDFISTRLFSVL
jgi:hypothetical protein